MKPVLILAQGRSGGTWFADEVAKLVGDKAALFYEPLNTDYNIRESLKIRHTPPINKHRVRTDMFRAYHMLDVDKLLTLPPCERLLYIVLAAQGQGLVPVVKVCRFAGRAEVLAACYDWHVLHFWREFQPQFESRAKIELGAYYWGEAHAYGTYDEYEVWRLAKDEGQRVADLSIQYEDLVNDQEHQLDRVGELIHV